MIAGDFASRTAVVDPAMSPRLLGLLQQLEAEHEQQLRGSVSSGAGTAGTEQAQPSQDGAEQEEEEEVDLNKAGRRILEEQRAAAAAGGSADATLIT